MHNIGKRLFFSFPDERDHKMKTRFCMRRSKVHSGKERSSGFSFGNLPNNFGTVRSGKIGKRI